MKRQWTADDLVEHWTLSPDDRALLANRAPTTRLGFALLLKHFQYEGRFPQHKRDVPTAAIVHVARQLGLPPERYVQYDWDGRTIEFHRAQVRQALGFRTPSTRDAADLARWLEHEVLPYERRPERLQAAVCERCRICHIELPAPGRVDRLIRSAVRTYEDHLHRAVLGRIGPEGLTRIDALLAPDGAQGQEEPTAEDAEDAAGDQLTLHDLKRVVWRKGEYCTLRPCDGSQGAEAAFLHPLVRAPGVIARQVDMVPVDRRDMGEQPLVNHLTMLA
jgi:hypothetical protein